MSSEVNQTDLFKTRIYQFLSEQGDWKSQADCIQQDGIVTNAEFHTFLDNVGFWNGEISKDDDLVNQFWKTIDTQTTGQVKRPRATRSDNGALNAKELQKMQLRIDAYSQMNEFLEANIEAPNDLNYAQFKSSVAASLGNSLEKDFLAKNGKLEDLNDFLTGLLQNAQKKTAANMYAQEFIKSLGDVVSKYGYKDDDVLQNIISAYVKNLESAEEVEDMAAIYSQLKTGAEEIVVAYLATAGIDAEGQETQLTGDQKRLLAENGYNVDASLPLNGLQAAIVKTNVKEAIENAKSTDEAYQENPKVFDAAIEKYLEELVAGASYNDFDELKGYGLANFKSSKAYTTVKASNALEMTSSPASGMYTTLANAGLGTLADNIANSMTGEYPAWETIKNDLINRAAEGEFGLGDNFDAEALNKAAFDSVIENLMEGFYPNGFDKTMKLADLNTLYDSIETAVLKSSSEGSISTFKKATISYCDVIKAKGGALKEALEEVFGEKYSEAINNMSSAEIRTKMAELENKVLELGDPSTFELTSISGISDNITLDYNKTETYNLSAQVTNPETGESIDSSRIDYKVKVTGSGIAASVTNGILTIQTGGSEGTMTVQIQAMVDGVAIGKAKNVTVKVETKKEIKPTDLQGVIYDNKNMSDFYGKNQKVNIAHWAKSGANTTAISSMTTILSNIKNAAIKAGYNAAAVEAAYTKALALYTQVCNDHIVPDSRGIGDYQTTYDGETYSYVSQSWRLEKTCNSCDDEDGAEARTNSTNHLGIEFSESYAGSNTYKVEVNLSCVVDIFNKFYKQAMGAA